MLAMEPKLDVKKQIKCMEMWRQLGPLTLTEICQFSEMPLDFDPVQTDYTERILVNG